MTYSNTGGGRYINLNIRLCFDQEQNKCVYFTHNFQIPVTLICEKMPRVVNYGTQELSSDRD